MEAKCTRTHPVRMDAPQQKKFPRQPVLQPGHSLRIKAGKWAGDRLDSGHSSMAAVAYSSLSHHFGRPISTLLFVVIALNKGAPSHLICTAAAQGVVRRDPCGVMRRAPAELGRHAPAQLCNRCIYLRPEAWKLGHLQRRNYC